MADLVAKTYVHETSQPVPNLMFTWYATSELRVPDAFQDPKNWEALRNANWEGLSLTRIGSAITNEEGYALLSYEADSLEGFARRSFNIWYTIETPEVVGTPNCSRIIHVSCQLALNASEQEAFTVRIPQSVIEQNGIVRKAAPRIDSSRTADDFDVALGRVEQGAVGSLTPGVEAFSTKFNQEIVRGIEIQEKELGRRFDPMAFPLGLNIQSNNASGPDTPEVIFDEQNRELRVRNSRNQSEKPITFDGIVRYTNPRLTNKDMKRPHVLVDEDTGRVRLALPRVPDTLELSENEPSPLFTFSTRDPRGRAESGRGE